MRGVQGWVIPPAPTTSMCALNMSVPPSPLPWATAITLARPGPSSCNSVSSSTLSSQPATNRAISASASDCDVALAAQRVLRRDGDAQEVAIDGRNEVVAARRNGLHLCCPWRNGLAVDL
jgi:hypothetical protein